MGVAPPAEEPPPAMPEPAAEAPVVDDATRLAYVARVHTTRARPAPSAPCSTQASGSPDQIVHIERVLTDNAWACTSSTFAEDLGSIDARHTQTRLHPPQTNGKSERLIKKLVAECVYAACIGRSEPTPPSRPDHPHWQRW